MSDDILRGNVKISEYVGINPKEIKYYHEHMGLPVFKIATPEGRSSRWLAFRDDLNAWVKARKDDYYTGRK